MIKLNIMIRGNSKIKLNYNTINELSLSRNVLILNAVGAGIGCVIRNLELSR